MKGSRLHGEANLKDNTHTAGTAPGWPGRVATDAARTYRRRISAAKPASGLASYETRFEMTDRTAELEAAVRAQNALISEAQRLLKAYVETKRVHPDAVINDLLWLFDGPRQHKTQRLVREALRDDPGNVP
jgi:hypothetical protein